MHLGVLSDPRNFHTRKWAQALKDAGAEVTVFSILKGEVPGIKSIYIEPQATLNGQINYGSYLYSGARLRTALEEHKVDVLNPINITPFGVWGMRSGFRPMVSIAMGADVLEYPPQFGQLDFDASRVWNSSKLQQSKVLGKMQDRLKWSVFRHYVKQTLEASDLITGANLELVKAVRDWFEIPADRVKLNRWGIEPKRFQTDASVRQKLKEKYGVRDWQKVILSPRGMKPVYQADLILEGFERLLRRGVRDLKLIMLSAGYDVPPALDQKAIQLAAQFENFHYERGLIPREEVLQLWSIVDAVISAPVYDGYSNALSEGRYAGAVPIVNAIPANLELIEHQKNGWIIDPFTPEHLADGILELMEDHEHWQRLFAPRNRQWIEQNSTLKYNIEAFLQDCEQIKNNRRFVPSN
jgi:glycosyltransferase involved in cell wall biosynthesis